MVKNGSTPTIIIGLLLIVIGILSRVLTGTSSVTALIPAFFGVPITILGWLSLAPTRTRWSMIVVCVLALLGIFGTYSAVGNLAALLQGESVSASTIARGSMFVLCIIQILVSINPIMRRKE